MGQTGKQVKGIRLGEGISETTGTRGLGRGTQGWGVEGNSGTR